ncbi:MAG: Translation initiation factor eIF-2B subunit epsilon [Marteilia pararefringens]
MSAVWNGSLRSATSANTITRSLIVCSLPCFNELDLICDPNVGPWSLKILGVPIIETLIENINTSFLKSDTVYFLILSKWYNGFKKMVRSIIKNLESEVEFVFCEIEPSIIYLGDALRHFNTSHQINETFLLITNPCVISESLTKFFLDFADLQASESKLVMSIYSFKNIRDIECYKFSKHQESLNPGKKQRHSLRQYFVHNSGFLKKITCQYGIKSLPLKLLNRGKSFELLATSNVPCIYACKYQIFSHFDDNFDIQSMSGLISWIISKEEILNQLIGFLFINEYGRALQNICDLQQINADALCQKISYTVFPASIYFENMFQKHSDPFVLIHKSSIIHPSTKVSGYVFVGKNCEIKENCHLINCILMHSTIINSNCNIKNTLIQNQCQVQESVCLKNVLINGHIVVNKSLDTIIHYQAITNNWNCRPTDTENIDYLIDCLDKELEELAISRESDKSDIESVDEGEKINSSTQDSSNEFSEKVCQIIRKALAQNKLNSTSTDIQVIRNDIHMENETFQRSVFDCIFICIIEKLELLGGACLPKVVKNHIQPFENLLKYYVHDLNSQLIALDVISNRAYSNTFLLSIISAFLFSLYEFDIFTDQAILQWYQEMTDLDFGDKDFQKIQPKLEKFIEWLQESEEDSS